MSGNVYANPNDLIPQEYRPVPLPNDFYKIICAVNPPADTKPEKLLELTASRRNESAINREAEGIVELTENLIQDAAERLSVKLTSLPRGPMYHDLVSTSFNEEQFLRSHERKLEEKRQITSKAARRST